MLVVEFIQFNALPFNPSVGAWQDIGSFFSSTFRISFLMFDGPAGSSWSYDKTLWLYFGLGMGWVLFAFITLWITRRSAHNGASAVMKVM